MRARIFSPKLGVVLGPWARTAYFLNLAEGYHSNDARGVTRSGQNPEVRPVTPLTRALSAELGLDSDPRPLWHTALDVFLLKLKSELVFEGDSGATSPSGATTRAGIEWGNMFRLNEWLHADLDAAFSRARFDADAAPDDLGCAQAAPIHPCSQFTAISGRHVPNSPTQVISAGLTARHPCGWFGSLKMRHFGESPLAADNGVRSPAYTTFDLQLGFQDGEKWRVAVDAFNVLDVKWNDIEYYYASRLPNEPAARPGIVAHPGVPRTIRVQLLYSL